MIRFLFLMLIGFSLTAQPLQVQWSQTTTANDPAARTNASAVYVPAEQWMVLFGGQSGAGYENKVWALDLTTNSWSELPSSSTQVPDARHTQEAFYDSPNHRMIIWGGQGTGGLYNDVWAFNFSDSSWTELFANGNVAGAPLRRYGTGAVYLPDSGRLVSFAGFTTSGRFDDTWAFDVNTQQWTDVSQTTRPLQRCLFNSAYYPDSNKMLIFGGQSSGNLNDLWSLDLDSYSWTELTPTQQPTARHYASLTRFYDPAPEFLLFGGNTSGQNVHSGGQNDLWRFNMNTMEWDTLGQSVIRPAKRSGHTAIMVNPCQIMIYGGHLTNGTKSNEVWTVDLIQLSVHSTAVSLDAQLFPNPVQNQLQIQVIDPNSIQHMQIINLTGQLLWQKQGYQEQISVQDLPDGQYFLTISTQNSKQSFPFVIQH